MGDPVSAGIMAGGSLLGGVLGSQKSGGSSSTSSNDPWSAQQPYLTGGFQDASNLYAQQGGTPVTQYEAGENGMQSQGITNLNNYGTAIPGVYQGWNTAGTNMQGYQPQYSNVASGTAANGLQMAGVGGISNATGILANYAHTGQLNGASSVNSELANSITSAGQTGMNSLGQANTVANQVANNGLNASYASNAASQAGLANMSNPALAAQIASGQAQIQTSLGENGLPAIRQAALASGNANSSREGALEGQAIQGASLADASLSSSLMGNAYNTGYSGGLSSAESGLGSALNAGGVLNTNGATSGSLLSGEQGLQQQQMQNTTGNILGAANSSASQNLAYQTADTGAMLSGNSQLGAGLNTGLSMSNSAVQNSLTGLDAALGAGNSQQQQSQLGIQNNIDLAQEPWQQLQNYWNIVGNRSYGSQTTGSQTPNNGGIGGGIAGAIGGASTAYGLYNNLSNMGGSSNPFAGA